MRVIFDAKRVAETVSLAFDFASRLSVGETISSQVVTATTYSGTDASPSSIISGSATASGTVVRQAVAAGVLGVTYLLLCQIVTSASQTLDLEGFLTVVPGAN